jgi:uncharacterized protein YaiI (UPF0178 family)
VLDIYVDADGCPVKREVYRVASRYDLRVLLVANAWMRVPQRDSVKLVLVGDQFDAADDWIVEHVTEDDIVVCEDIPLASRCLKQGARVLTSRGRVFTEASIGAALASRDLMSYLRGFEMVAGGPPPFEKRDRSKFLQRLDEIIHTIRRERERDGSQD